MFYKFYLADKYKYYVLLDWSINFGAQHGGFVYKNWLQNSRRCNIEILYPVFFSGQSVLSGRLFWSRVGWFFFGLRIPILLFYYEIMRIGPFFKQVSKFILLTLYKTAKDECLLALYPACKIAKNTHWRSVFLFNRSSKYDAVLSKIHSSRQLFCSDFADQKWYTKLCN